MRKPEMTVRVLGHPRGEARSRWETLAENLGWIWAIGVAKRLRQEHSASPSAGYICASCALLRLAAVMITAAHLSTHVCIPTGRLYRAACTPNCFLSPTTTLDDGNKVLKTGGAQRHSLKGRYGHPRSESCAGNVWYSTSSSYFCLR